jgi:hypothetical protein
VMGYPKKLDIIGVNIMIIESITPHPSEDDLDVVTLGPGTKCVVHKGQFKPGDSVKFVPVKTVKKGIICHGLIAHDDSLSMAEVFSGSEDILERVHSETTAFDPKTIHPLSSDEFYIDDAEEDAKIDED